MTDKEKILQYIKFKGISKNKFCAKNNFGVGFLDSGSSLGVDKLRIILDNYPDLNPEWLLTGKENMIRENKGSHIQLIKGSDNYMSGGDMSVINNSEIKEYKKQIEEYIKQIEEYIRQIEEYRKQISEKDKQISEKDKQIIKLIDIIPKS